MESLQLKQLQQWVSWAVTEPRALSDVLKKPGAAEPKPRAFDFIESSSLMSSEDRLNIYADGYYSRLRSIMADDFKAIHHLFGEDLFSEHVLKYFAQYPSKSFTVASVGRHFERYLSDQPGLLAEFPFVAELAHLEWAMTEVYFENDRLLNVSELSTVSQDRYESIRLVVSARVRAFQAGFQVHSIRKNLLENKDGTGIRPTKTFLVVYREGFDSAVIPVSATEFQVLCLLRSKKTLGAVCNFIAANGSTLDVNRCFQSWMAMGFFEGFSL